jgi:hypothetical protein
MNRTPEVDPTEEKFERIESYSKQLGEQELPTVFRQAMSGEITKEEARVKVLEMVDALLNTL